MNGKFANPISCECWEISASGHMNGLKERTRCAGPLTARPYFIGIEISLEADRGWTTLAFNLHGEWRERQMKVSNTSTIKESVSHLSTRNLPDTLWMFLHILLPSTPRMPRAYQLSMFLEPRGYRLTPMCVSLHFVYSQRLIVEGVDKQREQKKNRT